MPLSCKMSNWTDKSQEENSSSEKDAVFNHSGVEAGERPSVDMSRFDIPKQETPKNSSTIQKAGAAGAIGIYALIKSKILLPFLKFFAPLAKLAKGAKIISLAGKFLTTSGSMVLSIWFYAQTWGWKFATGFVFGILVHEMGHVVMAARCGVPVTAPLFIPGFGAMILQKQKARSVWDDALIGIGGPIGGLVIASVFFAIGNFADSRMFLALAYTTCFMNIFNLMPIMPFDGGWITRAISPRLWALGVVGLIGLFVSGYLTNPFIIYIIVLSLPTIWRGFKTGDGSFTDQEKVTQPQRLSMTISYIALCAILGVLMMMSYAEMTSVSF